MISSSYGRKTFHQWRKQNEQYFEQDFAVANCSINVSANENLENVEKLIQNALPSIKQNVPTITGEIEYKGINNLTDVTIELLFSAQCYEEDLYQVQRDLQRQLKLLFDKNGIDSFAPPTYKVDEKKKKTNKKIILQKKTV